MKTWTKFFSRALPFAAILVLKVSSFLSGFLLLGSSNAQAQQLVPLAGGFTNISSLDQSNQYLFILDGAREMLIRLDPQTQKRDSLGGRGFGDYQFDGLRTIDPSNGMKIYLGDYNNGRVQVFDRRFQFLTSINGIRLGSSNREIHPFMLTTDLMGQLHVIDDVAQKLHQFDFQGRFQGSIDLVLDNPINEIHTFNAGDEYLWLSYVNDTRLFRYSLNGLYQNFYELDAPILDVAQDSEGRFHVLTEKGILVVSKRGRTLLNNPLPQSNQERFLHIALVNTTWYLATQTAVYSWKEINAQK